MKTFFDGRLLYVVMEKGERVAQDLRFLVAMPAMKQTGTIISALGLLKNLDIGYGSYEDLTVSYDREILAGPLELLALSGFIMKSEAQPFHFHASFGNRRKEAFGGHLFDADVVTFIEMSILLSDAPVRRILKDGLPEMDFTEVFTPGND
jgi:predicted DNA-binding protein with PD1-like motif